MKNNEIMISARFESETLTDEISLLVIKDITVKALIEALYYGLKKHGFEKHFALLDQYLKTRKEIQVLYSHKDDFKYIDFAETYTVQDADGSRTISVLDKPLDELGIVGETIGVASIAIERMLARHIEITILNFFFIIRNC